MWGNIVYNAAWKRGLKIDASHNILLNKPGRNFNQTCNCAIHRMPQLMQSVRAETLMYDHSFMIIHSTPRQHSFSVKVDFKSLLTQLI